MTKIKKIGSLIGFTMLVSSVVTTVPLVSTSCGNETIPIEFESSNDMLEYEKNHLTTEIRNDPGQDYRTSSGKISYSGEPDDPDMLNDVKTHLNNVDTFFWMTFDELMYEWGDYTSKIVVDFSSHKIASYDVTDYDYEFHVQSNKNSVFFDWTRVDGNEKIKQRVEISSLARVYDPQDDNRIYMGFMPNFHYVCNGSFWKDTTFPIYIW